MSTKTNIQLTSQEVGPLFVKLSDRTITNSEIVKLIQCLLVLKTNDNITQGEYDIIIAIISKFAKIEIITTNNIKAERKNNQLAQKINFIDLIYLTNIVFKIQGRFRNYSFISKAFSGIFQDGTSFYDFISKERYQHKPHEKIGKGGFGNVFKLDFDDVHFVLKEIPLPNIHSIDLVVEEILALQRVIGKTYAVQLLASAILFDTSFTLGGRLGVAYILYPYIEGRTLAVYQLEQHTEDEKRAVYLNIVKAVDSLHKNNRILHSDIKPENIWIPIDSSTPPFLLDFGLVQSLEAPVARNVGTPFFWSMDRYKAFLSNRRKQQAMTKGINWIATVKSFTGNITNNVPINNSSNHPNLSNAFRRLYRNETEKTIKRKKIKSILTGNPLNSNNSNSNNNTGNNKTRMTRRMTRRKTGHTTQNAMSPIHESTTFKQLHNNQLHNNQ